jgi:hypothetical protein
MTDDCRYCPQCGKSTVLAGSGALTIPIDAEVFAAVAAGSPSSARSEAADGLRASSTHNLLAEANLYRIRRQYTQAIDNCVAVLRAQPGDRTAHSLLGDIYRDQGKTDDAIQWYRMALDLGPNASDEAKLKQQEQERIRQAGATDPRRRSDTRRRLAPISASGSLPAGTVYLMGISPRRWLHGITIASLSFLGLLLLALSYTKAMPPRASIPHTSVSEAPAVTVGGGGILPAAKPGGGSVAAGATSTSTGLAAAGSGMRPDLTPPRGLMPAAPHRPTPPARPKAQAEGDSHANVPLAPVLAVKPLPQKPEPEQDFPGPISHFGFGTVTPPSASFLNTLNGLILPGGLRVAHIQPEPGTNAAVVTLAASVSAGDNEALRAALLRGIYRAAYAAFQADTTLNRLTVLVTPDANAGLAESALVTADIDRNTALTASPDADSPDALESRLLSVRWSLPAGPAVVPQSAPQLQRAPIVSVPNTTS